MMIQEHFADINKFLKNLCDISARLLHYSVKKYRCDLINYMLL